MTVSPRCPNCHPEREMGERTCWLRESNETSLFRLSHCPLSRPELGLTQQAHFHTASCYRHGWLVLDACECFFHWLPLSSFSMPLGQNGAYYRVDCRSHLGWMHLGWSLEFAFHASSQVGLLGWGPHLDNLQSTVVSWGRETVIHPPWFFTLTRYSDQWTTLM